MNITGSVFMTTFGTFLAVIWILLYFSGCRRYKDILNTSAAGKMTLSGIFFIGFTVMRFLKINIKTERFAEKRRLCSEVYGPEYAEFYTYLNTGAQITYTATLLPLSLLIGGAAGSTEFAFIGAAASVLLLFFIDADVKKKAAQKREQIMCELPDIISRLALLINAGMVLREAWDRIADSSDSVICTEMKRTGCDIRNGMPHDEAFERFADRCRTKEIRKFVSSLNQNLHKGSAGLVSSLRIMADEQWEEKKNFVKKKGSAVEQKLLLPMMMIFTAIILMIVVPVFTSMF